MKITIVLGAFFPVPPIKGGAVEKIWFELGREFARRGHDVTMISRAVPQFPREEVMNRVRHVRIGGFDSPRSLLWLKCLDLIYSVRAMAILPASDVVVTNTFWLPILIRDSYVHVARFPKKQMSFYRRAVRLQAPSQSIAEAIVEEAPRLAQKIKVVPYPAPRSMIEGEPAATSEREKVVLFVGRVHPEKGVHLLVGAFARLARTVFADWKLMIVGPFEANLGGGGKSYLASLRSLAKDATVEFAGPVFDSIELEKRYRRARLFVYASLAERGESFGLAPLEAMTHRCAVIVSNLACFRDFIADAKTGFVFDHRSSDPEAVLGQKLEEVVVDLPGISRVADAGYRKSREYSLESVADRFMADFELVASKSRA